MSAYVKLHYDESMEMINKIHLEPWSKLLKDSNINSHLSPYLDWEFVYHHQLYVDGTKIERETGFEYSIPKLTTERCLEIIDDFKALRLWPQDDYSASAPNLLIS